jgi:cardiolipin synthase
MASGMYTLPNLLTAGRLLLAPLVVWQLAAGRVEAAFWLFALAALTDLLDGNLARLLDQRSVFGAWLDPIADKVMLLSTLLMLVWIGLLPLWLGVVVALRDVVVLSGAAAYRTLTGGLEVAPTWWGKAATCAEFVLVTLVLADVALGLGAEFLAYLIHLTGILVTVSGLHYVWRWSRKTRDWLGVRPRA